MDPATAQYYWPPYMSESDGYTGLATCDYPSLNYSYPTPVDVAYAYQASFQSPADAQPTYWPSYQSDDHLSHPVIHAPVPISSYSTLLPQLVHNLASTSSRPPETRVNQRHCSHASTRIPVDHSPESGSPSSSSATPALKLETADGVECQDVPQVVFPTPCQLLAELAERDCSTTRARQRSMPSLAPSSSRAATSSHCVTPATKARHSKAGKVRSSSSVMSSPIVALKSLPATPKAVAALDSAKKPRPENIRKVYFRSVADYVGFRPTDPDTITSHDKKRHYLESLEQYVLWLHEQISFVGHSPLPLERVDNYRGLCSRSIRTMLVHLQDDSRRLYGELQSKDSGCPLFAEENGVDY